MEFKLLDDYLEGKNPNVECVLLDDPDHPIGHVVLRVSLDKPVADQMTQGLCDVYGVAYTDTVRQRAYYYLALCHLVDKLDHDTLPGENDLTDLMGAMMDTYQDYQAALKQQELPQEPTH